jgi:hypothetical protein
MNPKVRGLVKRLFLVVDFFAVLLVLPAALVLKILRGIGVVHFPLCKKALMAVGVFPIRNHYYEPLFDCRLLTQPLSAARDLPGINWNTKNQLALLESFDSAHELRDVPASEPANKMEFYFGNKNFGSGDAEYWYSIVRHFKPRRIIEIGCGYSTLVTRKALAKNKLEQSLYECEHFCIEPYEMPWLERTGARILRKKVEEVDISFFETLQANDVLFVDSSHVIRPQGDVVFEFLHVLPRLRPGVIVQIHDIFSPHDYLKEWVCDLVRLYDEQYLLEAFLTFNDKYKIIGAINFLHHFHYEALKAKCPFLSPDREPGSFYIQRVQESES